jgi:hypothetical protein
MHADEGDGLSRRVAPSEAHLDLEGLAVGLPRRTKGKPMSASKDPKVAGTDAAAGLRDYLHFRQQAIDVAVNDYGVKTPFKANGAEPLRDWLRRAAAAIIKLRPNFGPQWDQIWSHEMVDDVNAPASG